MSALVPSPSVFTKQTKWPQVDVVVMRGKAHVVDASDFQCLVVVVGEPQRPNQRDRPHAILPAGDAVVVGGLALGILAAQDIVGNHAYVGTPGVITNS